MKKQEFDKEFYEKTYLKTFSSYEEAYKDWKKTGLLGKKIYDQELDFFYEGQIGQDYYVINDIYKRKRGGFFVEFGACDGIFLSNTYILEKYFGWSGVCIEPLEDYYHELRKNRNCIVSNDLLFSKSGQQVNFSCQSNMEVSGIVEYKKNHFYKDNVIIKKTKTLNEVLDQNHCQTKIDYLSIDTEGTELEILSTFNFEKYFINYLCIEHGNNEKYEKEISSFLGGKGFSLKRKNHWDSEYINNNFEE